MLNLGLAGQAGSGKDTVADYLVEQYGFIKYSFSDALYREVAEAFGLPDESLLRDRATKDKLSQLLQVWCCKDTAFQMLMHGILAESGVRYPRDEECSPRQILQWWGTEYRRAQDPDYWIKQSDEGIYRTLQQYAYPELQPQYFVNTSVRFENERRWIHKFSSGNVWHIRRPTTDVHAAAAGHQSETPLAVLRSELVTPLWEEGVKVVDERELFNNDTIERLREGVDLLLSTSAKFVRVEPMLPKEPS